MVLRTFSPARAWRPAVVARLARTLGQLSVTLQCKFATLALVLCDHVPRCRRAGPPVLRRSAHRRRVPTGAAPAKSHPRPPARTLSAVSSFRQPSHKRRGPPVRWRAANCGGVQRSHRLRHLRRKHCVSTPQAVPGRGVHLVARLVAHQTAGYGLPNPALKRKANGEQGLHASAVAARAAGFRLALR